MSQIKMLIYFISVSKRVPWKRNDVLITFGIRKQIPKVTQFYNLDSYWNIVQYTIYYVYSELLWHVACQIYTWTMRENDS